MKSAGALERAAWPDTSIPSVVADCSVFSSVETASLSSLPQPVSAAVASTTQAIGATRVNASGLSRPMVAPIYPSGLALNDSAEACISSVGLSASPPDRSPQLVLAHLRATADVEPGGLAVELLARLRLAGPDRVRFLAERRLRPLRQVLEGLLLARAGLRLLHVALGGTSLRLRCHQRLLLQLVSHRPVTRRAAGKPR